MVRLLQCPIAQTVSMVMTIATNCNNTRNCISFCDRFGDPPRIMLTRPSTNTSATAPTAMGRMIVLRKDAMIRTYHRTWRTAIAWIHAAPQRSGFLFNSIRW